MRHLSAPYGNRQANIQYLRQREADHWRLFFCVRSPTAASPLTLHRTLPPPLNSPSLHKEETELAWVIWIIIISAFSASWVPEKVREQHEDRLISVLVLASIWQQTIGKGPWPWTQQHGTGQLPQTKHNNTLMQQQLRQLSEVPRKAGWAERLTALMVEERRRRREYNHQEIIKLE